MNNTVIKFSVQRMVCTGCGVETNANCNCGVAYTPKIVRAAEAIRANPGKSDRAIAAELGVSQPTVSRARKDATDTFVSVQEPRIGLDGKSRRMPKRVTEEESKIPTEEEADEAWQADVYDHACFLIERMNSEIRAKFFAYIERKYKS